MAYSAVTYKGTGSQTIFTIPFDYLQKDFVKVTVAEQLKTYAKDYNVNGRELSFPTAPPSGDIIKVYRETPTDRLVKWNEGSVLTASNMSTQQVQELHLLEESKYNLMMAAMVKTENEHKWESQYLPITHVGDPVDDTDAVNLKYIKKEETGFLATVNTKILQALATFKTTYDSYISSLTTKYNEYFNSLKNTYDNYIKTSSDISGTVQTLATQVEETKTLILSKVSSAIDSATKAKESETNAKTSEINARAYESSASTYKESAMDSMGKAKEAEANAKTSETAALSAKEIAVEASNVAQASKDASKSSQDAAKVSEENSKMSETNARASEIASKESESNASVYERTARENKEACETMHREITQDLNKVMILKQQGYMLIMEKGKV